MNKIILFGIQSIHLSIIGFVILTPFIGSKRLLMIHTTFVPNMMLRWSLNGNTCCLTLLENQVRKQLFKQVIDNDKLFMARIIEPIYDFAPNNKNNSIIIYGATTLLWCIGIYKLLK